MREQLRPSSYRERPPKHTNALRTLLSPSWFFKFFRVNDGVLNRSKGESGSEILPPGGPSSPPVSHRQQFVFQSCTPSVGLFWRNRQLSTGGETLRTEPHNS